MSDDRPYYVYVLRDGTGTPFYVGKGRGIRALVHIFDGGWTGNPNKMRVINAVRRDGGRVSIDIAGWFASPGEAMEEEARLISELGMKRDRSGPLENLRAGSPPRRTARKPAKSVQIGIRIPAPVKEVLDRIAGADDRPLSNVISVILQHYVAIVSGETPRPIPWERAACFQAVVARHVAEEKSLTSPV